MMNERVTCMECGHKFVPTADRITLRDFFASCALIAHGSRWAKLSDSNQMLSAWAYADADAMLIHREEEPKK